MHLYGCKRIMFLHNFFKRSFKAFILGQVLLSFTAFPAQSTQCSLGKAYKVAVFQAGSYSDFQKVFRQTTLALQRNGFINGELIDRNFLLDKNNSFQKMAQKTHGGCIEFVEDGFYDGYWDHDKAKDLADTLKNRIKSSNDISMVWALGTVAGQMLTDSSLNVPVLVMTPTDPESSGIIGPGEFSNKKNIHVQKEMNRYESELRLFYNTFKFKNLGVIIDDNPINQPGQAVPIIRKLSQELKFNLIECKGPVIGDNHAKTQSAFSTCALNLAANDAVDAVYVPMGNGASPDNFYYQIKPLIDRKLPIFSQTGENEVQMGALMALSNADLQASGEFEARVIERIVKGEKPEMISQYYYAPLNLCLNLETARLIDFKPSFDLLIGVDLVFDRIKK